MIFLYGKQIIYLLLLNTSSSNEWVPEQSDINLNYRGVGDNIYVAYFMGTISWYLDNVAMIS